MTLEELLKRKREILEIAALYGAKNVRVFGSVAKGNATSGSDVDILVDLEPDRTLFDLGGLLMDLESLLGCRVDVVTEGSLHDRIRDKVKQEAIAL